MRVDYVRLLGPEWMLGPMNATRGKQMMVCKKPSVATWRKMLVSAGGVPHSPIRAVMYRVFVHDVKTWTTVHYVRHHVGFTPWVKSQREDGKHKSIPRDKKPQGELIDMMFDLNANALINIGKARLCLKASNETRELMSLLKIQMFKGDEYDQELASLLQPPCEWYDRCFEIEPCGKLGE